MTNNTTHCYAFGWGAPGFAGTGYIPAGPSQCQEHMLDTKSYILTPTEQLRSLDVKKRLAALYQKNPNIHEWTRDECEFVKKSDFLVLERTKVYTMFRIHDSRAAEETNSALFHIDPASFDEKDYAEQLATHDVNHAAKQQNSNRQ